MRKEQFDFMMGYVKKGFVVRIKTPLYVYLFKKKNASCLKNSEKDGFFINADYVLPHSCCVQMASDRVLYAFDWKAGEWKKVKEV